MPETVAAFTDIIGSEGSLAFAVSGRDFPAALDRLLAAHDGAEIDIVFCVDTTETMAEAIEAIKADLPRVLSHRAKRFAGCRFGLVAYKDYFEDYLYKRFDFTRDVAAFAANLSQLRSGGGRDTPEAVYEALYSALSDFAWEAPKRLIVLVGDAPPHPLPRGSIDRSAVEEAARAARVRIDAVVGAL